MGARQQWSAVAYKLPPSPAGTPRDLQVDFATSPSRSYQLISWSEVLRLHAVAATQLLAPSPTGQATPERPGPLRAKLHLPP